MCFIQNPICFAGLRTAETLIIMLSPHAQYFLLQEKISPLITFSSKCLAPRQGSPDLNRLIRSWKLNWRREVWRWGRARAAAARVPSWRCHPPHKELPKPPFGREEATGNRPSPRPCPLHPSSAAELPQLRMPSLGNFFCSNAITIWSWNRDL